MQEAFKDNEPILQEYLSGQKISFYFAGGGGVEVEVSAIKPAREVKFF